MFDPGSRELSMPNPGGKFSCQPNTEPIPGYRLRRCIGRGGSGEVWEVEAPGGIAKAMKVTLTEKIDPSLAQREFEGLQKIRSIRHPFLLAIDRFDVVDGRLYIVMELADISLADRFSDCVRQGLRGIPRPELLNYLREASEVLDGLSQSYGLQHLDIKPTNLLLSSGHIKVADFGLVQPRNADMSQRTLAFSPGYAPPELFDGRIHATADQYGLAVTYQELLTGCRPYRSTNVVELAFEQLEHPPDISALPVEDQPIVRKALHMDVTRRFPSCGKLIGALLNPVEFQRDFSESHLRMHPPPVRQPESASPPTVVERRRFARGSRPAAVNQGHPTVSVKGTRTQSALAAVAAPPALTDVGTHTSSRDQVRATFLASLPLQIFALKLRAFIDALHADVLSCTERATELRLARRGLFGMRSSQAIFLRLETFRRSPDSNCSVVDVAVWSTIKKVQGEELVNRAGLLIRCLKTYFMATEENAAFSFEPAAVRNQLLE